MSYGLRKDTISFADANKGVDALETVLERFEIRIEPGSLLESIALGLHELEQKHRSPALQDDHQDIRPLLRESLGMNHLAQLILRVQGHPDFPELVNHLHLLNECNPLPNETTTVLDQGANKAFELLVACGAMHAGATGVRVDHPANAVGDNPDVIATMKDVVWGFACKVAHSSKGLTLFGNIEKGVDQIEKSPAVRGVVIINAKNLIAHDEFLPVVNEADVQTGAEPMYGTFKRYEVARDLLAGRLFQIGDAVAHEPGQEALNETFQGKKSIPLFVMYGHTVIGARLDGAVMPTSLGVLVSYPPGSVARHDLDVLNLLNTGMNHSPPP